MSIIRDVPKTLAEITIGSNVILEVTHCNSIEEKIPITGTENTVPPFIKKIVIFETKRVLKNTTGSPVADTIEVPVENWRRSFSQYLEHHANGNSKSYGVDTYETGVPSMEKADILFLQRFKETYELTARDSFESLENLQKIEQLI